MTRGLLEQMNRPQALLLAEGHHFLLLRAWRRCCLHRIACQQLPLHASIEGIGEDAVNVMNR